MSGFAITKFLAKELDAELLYDSWCCIIAHSGCGILRPKKKKLLYWRNPTDPKMRPDPTFFFLKTTKKKTKNDRPILKKAKPVIFLFKHPILALKMLIWGFETWLVA